MAGRLSLLAAAAVVLAPAGVAGAAWPVDAGGVYRQSSVVLSQDISGAATRQVWTFASNIEDTESEIEQYLLQSPLVTSFGQILVVNDAMTMSLLADPASLGSTAHWGPIIGAQWNPPDWLAEEPQFAGVVLDINDYAYVLDRRNRAVHAVMVSKNKLTQVWSTQLNTSHILDFAPHASMVPDSSTNQLWVPLVGTMEGVAEGVAAVFNMNTGAYVIAPLPSANPDCTYPEDLGSALIATPNGQAVVILSEQDCGMTVVDTKTHKVTYSTFPDSSRLFVSDGEHGHPVYDDVSSNLYYLDYSLSFLQNQKACCINTQTFGDCAGWPAGGCVKIPELGTFDNPQGTGYYRWEWMGAALWNNVLYVAASAPADDNPLGITSHDQLVSALYAYDTTSGSLIGTHRFNGDMFNSAPLVVAGNGGSGTPRLFISTTLGYIYNYAVGSAVAQGPRWTSQDLAPIPDDDLPASTYCFLTATPSGTLLVTSTAGGVEWEDEKVFFAIVNGVNDPVMSSSNKGLSAAGGAGVAFTVLAIAGIAGALAYAKVPAFAVFVNGMISSGKGLAGKAAGGAGYKGFGSTGAAAGAGAPAGATAGTFTGSSGSAGSAAAEKSSLLAGGASGPGAGTKSYSAYSEL